MKGEKIHKYLDLARELKTFWHDDDGDTNCSWCTWNCPQMLRVKNEGIGNKEKEAITVLLRLARILRSSP